MKAIIQSGSRGIVVGVFTAICIGILLCSGDFGAYAVAGGGIGIGLLVIRRRARWQSYRHLPFWLLLTGCFLVKAVTVCFFQPEPVADYLTYYNFAVNMMEDWQVTLNPLYLAVFPHVFGYAEVLSLLFRVFGEHVLVAVVANVLLSCMSMVFIYKICDRISGKEMAVMASVLWIVFPSQALWNVFILSEPLYVTELLAFWWVCLEVTEDRQFSVRKLIFAVGGGILLVLFNMSRPIGVIVVTALFIWMFLVKLGTLHRIRVEQVGVIVLVFMVGIQAADLHIQDRVGLPTGGFSWYNVSVGLNENSGGAWNEEDWNRMLTAVNRYAQEGYENPARETQMAEKEVALKKLTEIEKPWEFLKTKFSILLGNDSAVVEHLRVGGVELSTGIQKLLEMLTNGFYYMMVLLGLWGGIRQLGQKKSEDLTFVMLYSIGLTLGHMLAEVQGRYHYSILLAFLFLAAYGLSKEDKKDFSRNLMSEY